MEIFFHNDTINDPQCFEEHLIATKFCFAGHVVDIKSLVTQAIFEILEKSQLLQNCTMVDIKIGFGVNVTTKKIALAGIIDNDSCRLWPAEGQYYCELE